LFSVSLVLAAVGHGGGVTGDSFLRASTYSISGTVTYCGSGVPVENAVVIAASSAGDTTCAVTDSFGVYSLTGLSGGANYVVRPHKADDTRWSVSGFDANLILRYLVNMFSLDGCHMTAADVSGNCGVSSFDANLIMQHLLDPGSTFPVGAEWRFVPGDYDLDTGFCEAPDSIFYEALSANHTDQDYQAIVYGDVSLSWVSETTGITVTFNVAYDTLSDDTLLVHLDMVPVGDPPHVYNAEICFVYDPGVLVFEEADYQAGSFSQFTGTDTVFEDEGRFLYVGAGAVSWVPGSGRAFSAKFTYSDGNKIRGFSDWVSLIYTRVNEETYAFYGPAFCDNFDGLFCDDFEDGVITEWQVLTGSCTWIESNGILSTSNTGQEQWCLQTIGDQSWNNYVFEAKVRGNSGVDKVLVFRVQDANNYYAVNLRSDWGGFDEITFDKMVNGVYNADIVTAGYPSENGIWYHLQVACADNSFKVYVDDALVLEYTDNDNPYYTGGIGVACWTGLEGNCDISFDDVAVTLPATGSIKGIVTEMDGVTPISDALVQAWQDDIAIKQNTTGANGWYVLSDLNAGVYDYVVTTHPSYGTSRAYDVHVNRGEMTIRNFLLFENKGLALGLKMADLNSAIKNYLLTEKTLAAQMTGECFYILKNNQKLGLLEEIFNAGMNEGPEQVANIVVNLLTENPGQIVLGLAKFFVWEIQKYVDADAQNSLIEDLNAGQFDGMSESEIISYFDTEFGDLKIRVNEVWQLEYNALATEMDANLIDFLDQVHGQPIQESVPFDVLIYKLSRLVTLFESATVNMQTKSGLVLDANWQLPNQCDFSGFHIYEAGAFSTTLKTWQTIKLNYDTHDEIREKIEGFCDYDIPDDKKLSAIWGNMPLIGDPLEDILDLTYRIVWKVHPVIAIPCFGADLYTHEFVMEYYGKVIQFALHGLSGWGDDAALAYNLYEKVLDDVQELVLNPGAYSCSNDLEIVDFYIDDVCITTPSVHGIAVANVSIRNNDPVQEGQVYLRINISASPFAYTSTPLIFVERGVSSIAPGAETQLQIEIPVAPSEFLSNTAAPYSATLSIYPSFETSPKTDWFYVHGYQSCGVGENDETQVVYGGWIHTGQYVGDEVTLGTDVNNVTFVLNYLGSDVDLHVYDDLGRHVGMNYLTSEIDLEIPGAEFFDDSSRSEGIYVPGAGGQTLTISARGIVLIDSEYINISSFIVREHPAMLGVVEPEIYVEGVSADSIFFLLRVKEVGGQNSVTDINVQSHHLQDSLAHIIPDTSISFTVSATELDPGQTLIIPGTVEVPAEAELGDYSGPITITSSTGSLSLSLHVRVTFLCGDIDGITGPGGPTDVADLTYLVAYLFKGGPAPPVIAAANVDGIVGPGGPVDVADLTYLVAYLFKGGPAPVC